MNEHIVSKSQPRAGRRRLFIAVGLAVAVILALALWMRKDSDNQKAKPNSSEASVKGGTDKEGAGEGDHDPNLVVMAPEAQKKVGLALARAETKMVIETIQATGSVGPNETRVGHVRALASGRILKVNVRFGDRVQGGQILATYDNVELGEQTGQYGVARAALDRAQAEAQVTKRAMERAQNLVNLGAIAKAEVERRSAEYATALSAIETQRAELSRIEEKLHRFGLNDPEIRELDKSGREGHREASQSTLRAPFSGVVTAYNISEGETVAPDRELFTITDLSTVWVLADVYEKDLGAVRRGVTAKVSVDSYPGESFTGRVTYVGDVLDPKTRTARVRVEVPNRNSQLKLEMFASIELPSPKNREAVMLPATAVQQINDQPVAFVRMTDREFQRRDLKVGPRQDGWVEILSGVKAGESVVTQGAFRLKSLLLREEIGGEE